jgi:spore germination protein YaaH
MDQGKEAANTEIDKKFQGFGKFITERAAHMKNIRYVGKADSLHHISAPLRAAFYDAKDEQSYFSLKNNITKLNMLLPEWMYIDSMGDSVVVNTDVRGSDIIKASGVPVVAMLSNFIGDDFSGQLLHSILIDKTKRAHIIDGVLKVLQQNHFAGVNIDFEEIQSLVNWDRHK